MIFQVPGSLILTVHSQQDNIHRYTTNRSMFIHAESSMIVVIASIRSILFLHITTGVHVFVVIASIRSVLFLHISTAWKHNKYCNMHPSGFNASPRHSSHELLITSHLYYFHHKINKFMLFYASKF